MEWGRGNTALIHETGHDSEDSKVETSGMENIYVLSKIKIKQKTWPLTQSNLYNLSTILYIVNIGRNKEHEFPKIIYFKNVPIPIYF